MERLGAALDFIESNLNEAIGVEQIAAASGLSAFHFCRLFRRVMGETVMSYVRRRRLSAAAVRLRAEDIRLIELALESGFESQQAFHRAFKRMFGTTPGEFRRHETPPIAAFLTPSEIRSWNANEEPMKMEPRITDREAFTVVGLPLKVRRTTTHEISALWDRLIARAREIPGRVEGAAYGLLYNFDKREGDFDYLAGVGVGAKAEVPDGMTRIEVGAQTYAVFTHRIENPVLSQDLPRTFNYIYGTWLPNSDYVAAEGPEFEYYDSRFDPATNGGEVDLYIPVCRKAGTGDSAG
jgi:AraC family transcriptional regulator